MNLKQLNEILRLLIKSCNIKKSERKKYLKYCSDDEIHAICGACRNFLNENFVLPPQKKNYLKKKLQPIKNDIRLISNKATPVEKKRKVLAKDQVGNGIFSLLAGVIIPSIISALAPK